MKNLIFGFVAMLVTVGQCFAQGKKALTENYTWPDTMTLSRVIIWEDTDDWPMFDSLHKLLLNKFTDSVAIFKKRNSSMKRFEEFQVERYGDTLYFIQVKPYVNAQLKFVLSYTTYEIEEIFPKKAGENFMPGNDAISRIELKAFFFSMLDPKTKKIPPL